MTTPTDEEGPPVSLRVRILASDPVRRRGLQSIVLAAGHQLADDAEDGDVVLADGDAAVVEITPVVVLGGPEAGQAALLPNDATPAQIDAALRAAVAGLIVRAQAPQRHTFGPAPDDTAPLLSPREIEILALIGDGLSNKEVARRLGISAHTVKFHIESLYRKLAASSRAEAVHKGLRQGLIEL